MAQKVEQAETRHVKDVPVWDVEELQGNLELLNAFANLLMDNYAGWRKVEDGAELQLHLGICGRMTQAVYEQATALVNRAYGHD